MCKLIPFNSATFSGFHNNNLIIEWKKTPLNLWFSKIVIVLILINNMLSILSAIKTSPYDPLVGMFFFCHIYNEKIFSFLFTI